MKQARIPTQHCSFAILLVLLVVVAGGLSSPLVGAAPSSAPTQAFGRIEGQVFDQHTGHPIAGATIDVDAGTASTTTDAAGQFVLEAIPISGDYRTVTVTVRADGYGTWTMQETPLYPDIARLLDIPLTDTDTHIEAGLPLALTGEQDIRRLPESGPAPASMQRLQQISTIPATIRVARTGYKLCGDWLDAGRPYQYVEEVPFDDYVKNVLPNEWVASWDADALQAGAIAVKTFAWYKILTGVRASYGGADVLDNTCDQYYRPYSRQATTDAAVDATWNYVLHRNGELFPVFYLNTPERCTDSPYQPCMPQWGTQYDAQAGDSWQQILQRYYGPAELSYIGSIEPSPEPTRTPTPRPTQTATPWPTSAPTQTATPRPTQTATPRPTSTPLPTATPMPLYRYAYAGQEPADSASLAPLVGPRTVELRIMNTGMLPWYRESNTGCNIYLGTGETDRSSDPLRIYNHISPFYKSDGAGWLHIPGMQGRRVLLHESYVAPGEVATFRFEIALPEQAGTVTEYWSPFIGGAGCAQPGWLPGSGMHFSFEVLPFSYSVVSRSPQDDAWHTQPALFELVLRNEGSVPWYRETGAPGTNAYAVRLATGRQGATSTSIYEQPDHASPFCFPGATGWWAGTSDCNRVQMVEEMVPPGGTATFRFAATVPPHAGSIEAPFTPVVDSLGWMTYQEGSYLRITNEPYRAEYIGQEPADSLTLAPGELRLLTASFRNIGYASWQQGMVQLGTVHPNSNSEDYLTPFVHDSWISDTRPARLDQPQVAPGHTGNFSFLVQAPPTPGTYTLRVRPLIGGAWWMRDHDMHIAWTIHVVEPPTDTAHLAISPAYTALHSGETFSVTVSADTGSAEADTIAAYLRFDPAMLEVIDTTGQRASAVALDEALEGYSSFTRADNTTGSITIYATRSAAPYVRGGFDVATIYFRARTSGIPTAIVFEQHDDRMSDLRRAGASLAPNLPTYSGYVSVQSRTFYIPTVRMGAR